MTCETRSIARKNPVRRSGLHRIALAAVLCAASATAAYAADTANGAKLYQQYCIGCHGAAGDGMMPGAPNFSRGESLMQTDNALLNAIKNGKNAMPGFQGAISDKDILDIIAYLRTLTR